MLIKIINKAYEEENKEKLYLRYIALLPHMTKQISFDTFYKQNTTNETTKKLDKRSEEEIMKEILLIDKQFKKG